MKLLQLLAIVFSFSGVAAFAGDSASFKNLGFSDDGKFFAFAESGQQDGSGFYYAYVNVVNVASNKLVRLKSVVIEDDTKSVSIALNKAIAESKLSQFGIIAGKNQGTYLINRSEGDLSQYTNSVFTTNSEWKLPKYELQVQLKLMPDESEGKWCTDMGNGGPAGFKISLSTEKDGKLVSKILQEDSVLPKSRGCAFEYSVRKVIQRGTSFVVVLNYLSVGFEGPNTRYLAVTGAGVL